MSAISAPEKYRRIVFFEKVFMETLSCNLKLSRFPWICPLGGMREQPAPWAMSEALRFLETRQKAGQHGLISSFDFGDEIMPNHGAWEARTMEVSLEPLQHPLAGPDAGAPSRLSERAPHVRQDLFALSL